MSTGELIAWLVMMNAQWVEKLIARWLDRKERKTS